MSKYSKEFKEEALKLSDEIGVKKAALQLGLQYYTLADWRKARNGSKNAMRLVDYYNDMNDEQKAVFHKEALIPDGVSLELENFEEFYEKRKELLTAKIRQLLG